MTSHMPSTEKSGGDKKSKKKRKNTSLRLEKEMLKQLKQVALEKDTSIQEIIERLIRTHLEALNAPGRRSR